ncbi:MAG: diadenylate cyclase [Saprospiraceae bacterium]|nr:diadenylate cyclase [Saprospiraceae bacterium]
MSELLFILQVTGANPEIGFWDVIDFAIAAYLVYLLYRLLKGTAAFNIFIGVLLLYILWWTVGAMDMHILSTILDQFVSVGVIVLVIIFQPEIRRFLLMVGSSTLKNRLEQIQGFFKHGFKYEPKTPDWFVKLRTSIIALQENNLSALLVITDNLNHESFVSSGVRLNADLNKEICTSIALPDSPLNDGAMIVQNGKLITAGCSLPVAPKEKTRRSLAERSALGISQQSNAMAILVGPKKGLRFAISGEIRSADDTEDLMNNVESHLTTTFAL